MNESASPVDTPAGTAGQTTWNRILKTSLALPGAKVDRDSYLRSQLSSHFGHDQVSIAIASRPAQAGVSLKLVDELADSCIKSQVLKASAVSFVAGVPGGIAIAGTIPADFVQLQCQALILAQKLAYLYGWPDLLEKGEVDAQTEVELTLLFGTMIGASAAQRSLSKWVEVSARTVGKRLSKTINYQIAKKVGKSIGVRVTKRSFARGAAKVVPVVGGFINAGMTASIMQPMGKRLKVHLRDLRFARPEGNEAIFMPPAETVVVHEPKQRHVVDRVPWLRELRSGEQ